MQEKSLQADFVLGNMSRDLMNISFELCNKAEDGKPRFPKLLQRYSDLIIEISISINRNICIANSFRNTDTQRTKYQNLAKGDLVHLSHLIDVAFQNKWISEKQHKRWLGLCSNTYWKLINWIK